MRDLTPITVGFLADASPVFMDMMTAAAREIVADTGHVLFSQGDAGDSVFAIRSGALEFSVLSLEGRKLSLDVMRAGSVFGEIALFDPGPRTATVMALEPTRLWCLSNADILDAVRDDPEVGIELLRLAGKRMRWMGHQLREQVFLPLAARLAGKVLYLSKHDQSDTPMLALSKSELAEFTGASREAVSKIVSGWARDGYVESTRRGLRLLDRSALLAMSESQEN